MPFALFKFLVDHYRGIFLIYLKTMCASALNSNQEERQSTISSETLHPETPIQVHAARGGAMRTNLFLRRVYIFIFSLHTQRARLGQDARLYTPAGECSKKRASRKLPLTLPPLPGISPLPSSGLRSRIVRESQAARCWHTRRKDRALKRGGSLVSAHRSDERSTRREENANRT